MPVDSEQITEFLNCQADIIQYTFQGSAFDRLTAIPRYNGMASI